MRYRILPILILVASVAMILAPPASANSTLFYDNFSPNSAGFPSKWSPTDAYTIGNVSQNANYATMTIPRASGATNTCMSSPFPDTCMIGMIANNTGIPIIGPNTMDGQFVQSIWRMAPFNLTSPGTTGRQRLVELLFGLGQQPTPTQSLFALIALHVAVTEFLPYNNQRSIIAVQISHPMANVASCFINSSLQLAFGGPAWDRCGGGISNKNEIFYSGTVPFDLNQIHVFTMQGRFFPVSHTSWIAFSVDGNGWLNVTQTACSCIDQTSAGGSYASLYPFIDFVYHTVGGAIPNQSVSNQLNYLLVSDYPAAAPAGQMLPASAALPPAQAPSPTSNPFCGIFCSGSNQPYPISSYMIYIANSLSPGNVFFGGYILTLALVMGFSLLFAKLGMRFTWGFVICDTGITLIMFSLGVIGLWTIILQFLILGGLVVGLYKANILMGDEDSDISGWKR